MVAIHIPCEPVVPMGDTGRMCTGDGGFGYWAEVTGWPRPGQASSMSSWHFVTALQSLVAFICFDEHHCDEGHRRGLGS